LEQQRGNMHPIFKVSGKISPYFRRRRFHKFLEVVSPTPSMRILDVGGLPRSWLGVPIQSEITILNIEPLCDYEASFLQANHVSVVGDGTRLSYADQSFDLVYSNSVIEHLGTWGRQQAFAAEARRVGRGYWIQTPGREFPVEPHYFGPFVHWFSKPIQKRLLRNFTLWGLLGRPTNDILDAVLAELRLLSFREYQLLFRGAQMWVERLLGLPKSYTAYVLPR
jgi:Methyltransferase domain